MKKLLIVILVSLLFVSCSKDGGCLTTCNDGTTSGATGSGACSYHGGVSSWGCGVDVIVRGKNY